MVWCKAMLAHSTPNTKKRDVRTYSIIGAAMEVHRRLGCGFLEAVYQEALSIEFTHLGIPFVREPGLEISYRDTILATYYRPDFVCHGSLIVELKAIKEITSIEEAQVVNYLRASGSRIGLVINFGAASLQFKRVANMELLAPKRVPRIDDLRPVPPSTFLEAQHPSVNLSNL